MNPNEPSADVMFIRRGGRWTLRQMLGVLVVGTVAMSHLWTSRQLHRARAELESMRSEVGYLNIRDEAQLAVARVPDDEPLVWRFRIHNPQNNRMRLAYSTRWLSGSVRPDWYSFAAIPAGESLITARVAADPRDSLWKISVIIRQGNSETRLATELPESQVPIFRGSHHAISTGEVETRTLQRPPQRPIKLLEDKWLVDESPMVLFGQRPPDTDVIGVFLEIQPDGKILPPAEATSAARNN
jgi:hypothetical protein